MASPSISNTLAGQTVRYYPTDESIEGMLKKDKSVTQKLLNIVAFCSLMENGGGIADKSPQYILEKYQRYCEDGNEYHPAWRKGLDKIRRKILGTWAKKWLSEAEKKRVKGEAEDKEWKKAPSANSGFSDLDSILKAYEQVIKAGRGDKDG